MPDYRTKQTEQLEPIGANVLIELGFNTIQNNKIIITDPDYKLDNGDCFDFQFSQNFSKYQEVRIDLISAYKKRDKINRRLLQEKIELDIEKDKSEEIFQYINKYLNINKKGKYFDSDEVKAVIYFFYNNEYKLNITPDNILLISTISVREFIYENWRDLIDRGSLKLNDKSDLGDNHGSAFICIKLNQLVDRYCSYENIKLKQFQSSTNLHIDKSLKKL